MHTSRLRERTGQRTDTRIPATLLLVAALLPPVALAQRTPALAQPIDCRIGAACIVQNYVDHAPGAGARDYRCGFLSYDGHKGTDIRVIDAQAYKQGVAVLAAAPGRVRAVRDAMPDASVRVLGKAAVAGQIGGEIARADGHGLPRFDIHGLTVFAHALDPHHFSLRKRTAAVVHEKLCYFRAQQNFYIGPFFNFRRHDLHQFGPAVGLASTFDHFTISEWM